MIDSERDPIIERIAQEARRPVAVDAGAKARLLAAISAEGMPGSVDDDIEVGAMRRPGILLSGSRFAALAAGLVGVGALLGSNFRFGRDSQGIGQPSVVVADGPSPRLPASTSDTVMTFVFVTHGASTVSIVGDFNQWNAEATPMRRIENTNAWTVTVPLAAGRHLYSFFAVGADGEKWLADPNAPAAPDDGFGRVNSVVLVGKGSSS
jgi:hypothetical protein